MINEKKGKWLIVIDVWSHYCQNVRAHWNTAILIENEAVVPRGAPTMEMRFEKKKREKIEILYKSIQC